MTNDEVSDGSNLSSMSATFWGLILEERFVKPTMSEKNIVTAWVNQGISVVILGAYAAH